MSRICRVCQRPDSEVEFMPNANICKPCNKEYMKQYRKANREKLSTQVQEWKDTNREHYKESCRVHYNTPEGKAMHVARVCKTHRTWFSHLLASAKSISKNPGPHDPKSGPQLDFDIDMDYIDAIWQQQGGKCALTGLQMTHVFNNLKAASIDRIDSSQGHVKGNIQLVCQFINRAKNKHTNEEMLAVLNEIKEIQCILG